MSGAVHVALQWYGQHRPRADDCATIVPKDSERCRPVAALSHGDERDRWGAGARKGKSDGLPDTILVTSLLFVTPFQRWLGIFVRRFLPEFGRSARWGETANSLRVTVGNGGSREPETGI